MAKIVVKNLKQVESRIRKIITKALRDKDVRDGIGEVTVNGIQAEPSIVTSDKTIKMRRYLEKGNKTSDKYDINLINITFTGELLDDLKNNTKLDISEGSVGYIIDHSDKKHKKYKKPDGKPLKGASRTYKELSDIIVKKYNYLKFSKITKQEILEFIKNALFKKLK